jgi:hypothetical protein
MADKTPAAPRKSMPESGATSGRAEIAEFIVRARGLAPGSRAEAEPGAGRLIFALDATMSRQPTWDAACSLQAEMFRATEAAGGLSVQLAYFRGINEARASRWVSDADALSRLMTGLACHGGLTQIGRILDHAAREARRAPVAALVYVGDAMEENIDALCAKAGELALRRMRAFMFLEGRDPAAERAFREIARLTGGVMLPFDRSAAGELRALLGAVATYAAGGRAALEAAGTGAAARLLADLRP